MEWASGEIAHLSFGPSADALDAVFLLSELAHELETALRWEVHAARGDGASWQEVADALGVSRQAATKRFEWRRSS